MATFTKVTDDKHLPSSVERGRDGIGYIVGEGEDKLGYVAHIGFYSDTWSAWTPLGTFVAECNTRREAVEALREKAEAR